MTLRSASLFAGLSLTAAFVLALPLAVEAGAHAGSAHCNCGGASAHSYAGAHASARASVRVSTSSYGHSGGYPVHPGYAYHGGGYGHQDHYPAPLMHYPTHSAPRYSNHGDHYADTQGDHYTHGQNDHYASNGGYDSHRYYAQRAYNDRVNYRGGNSYSVVYAPTYDDSDYSGGGGYAAPADYAQPDYAPQQDDAPQSYGDDYAPPPAQYDNGGYADADYSDATYDDAAYAPPPVPTYAPQYSPAPACTCAQPVVGGAAQVYGWRDQYGAWHVTSQTSQSSYSYSYSSR